MKRYGYCLRCKAYKKIKGFEIDKENDIILKLKCKHLRIVRLGSDIGKLTIKLLNRGLIDEWE